MKIAPLGTLWREDHRCGPMYPLKDSSSAQCDPNHQNGHTCCSPGGWCGLTPAHCTCSGCIDYNQEPLLEPHLTSPEEVVIPKGYSAIILDEYVIDANFTLEHCGCQRYLKGIVIPFVEMQVLI